MAKGNFEACLGVTLQYEGGFSNHPADPGGVTLEGIIQRVYDAYRRSKGLSTRPLTKAMRGTASWIAERNDIYRANYWNVVRGDDLPGGVDLAVNDFGVNSGPSRSAKYLQAILGVAQDGRIGTDETLPALRKADGKQVIQKLCAKRMSFLRGLGTFKVFGRGWSSRVASVEAKAVAMWLTFSGVTGSAARKTMADESSKAGKIATVQKTAAGGSGLSVGTASGDHLANAHNPDWLLIGVLVVVGLIVVGVLVAKAKHNKERAAAYAAAAA